MFLLTRPLQFSGAEHCATAGCCAPVPSGEEWTIGVDVEHCVCHSFGREQYLERIELHFGKTDEHLKATETESRMWGVCRREY